MRNYELDKINKTVTESNIHLCQYCGKEVDRRRIFCDEHNTDLNKQIYEFFVDLPLRPRGKYAYAMLGDYLKAKLGLTKQKRFIIKAPSGSGKSILMDMIGYLELTHFPGSFTIIGSISYPVATEHIRRIRQWVRNSLFGKYIHGMEATASKEEITLERSQSRMLAIASQAETSRSGYHPCFDKETEVLTRAGWKNVADVQYKDLILTFDKDTNQYEWQYPISISSYDYDGTMLHFKQENSDLVVTPDHRIIYKSNSWQDRWLVKKAKDIKNHHHFIIPAVGYMKNGESPKYFKIENKKWPIKRFLKFLGYYISEGRVRVYQNGKCGIGIEISQIEESRFFGNFEKVLRDFTEDTRYLRNGSVFILNNKNLAEWVHDNCGNCSLNKEIPDFLYDLHPKLIKIFVDAYMEGDGDADKRRAGTVSYKLADGLQILSLLCGKFSSIRKRIEERKEWNDLYRVGFLDTKVHFFDKTYITEEKYKDKIYAISVPNSFLVVRRNKKPSVVGNSLLLLDEVGRFRPQSYYQLFYQLGRSGGVLEIAGSTPFLDSKIMMEFWNADDVQRYALELEDAWWISKEQIRNAEKTLPPELFDQLYRAKFRSISNRVIPDDLFLESISRGVHLSQSQNLLMGIDFGHKIDPTAVVVIDMETGDIKFATQFSDDWQIQFAKIRQLYQEWKPIRIEADSSSIGDVVISELSDLPIEGVSMHNDILKKRVIDRLTMAFINHKVNIVADEFPLLVSQLSSYVYLDQDHKKMGPSGRGHDDFVDALGLALMAFDVSSVSDMRQADNIWTFTRVPGSSASPWKIGGF